MKYFALLSVLAYHGALASFLPSEEVFVGEAFGIAIDVNDTAIDFDFGIAASTPCLSEMNQQRARNGRPALQANGQVERAAANHNRYMMDRNCFSHQCPGEPPLGQRLSNVGYAWRGAGENLALGHRDCAHAVEGWMNSPGHRDNLLGNWRHVGCSRGSNQRGNWWTCVYANPR